MKQLEEHEDIGRIGDAPKLPWYFKRAFGRSNLTRYAYDKHYFLALLSEDDPNYKPCLDYLHDKFYMEHDTTSYANKIVDIVMDPAQMAKSNAPSTNRAILKHCAESLLSRFLPNVHIPDDVLHGAFHQMKTPTQTVFFFWGFSAARRGVKKVTDFIRSVIEESGDLEKYDLNKEALTIQLTHILLTGALHFPKITREIAKYPQNCLRGTFARLGRTKDAPRMAKRDTTVGGMFPDNYPIKAGKTVLKLEIGLVAKETEDCVYAFEAYKDSKRYCKARNPMLQLFGEVKQEILRRSN
eukprot:CAMPEP_0184864740 /NCGR_PEP_ID=MMETSP0580-20130426/15958_1 /TAXON_ID=1118495 /ORGANISM="Dactyliosolen fragilissimus" /LENGTH=296 /DNA_ID=CAMNT_0027363651 /DNA_START=159 /DNA_END=1049 /DNA_ORIENTATION=+